MQHAKDNTKQIFNINSKAAKTFEQNSRELTKQQHKIQLLRYNAYINSRQAIATTAILTTTTTYSTSSAKTPIKKSNILSF